MCLYVCKCIQRVYTKLQIYIKRRRIYVKVQNVYIYWEDGGHAHKASLGTGEGRPCTLVF